MKLSKELNPQTIKNKIKRLEKHFNHNKRGGHGKTAAKNDTQALETLAALRKL